MDKVYLSTIRDIWFNKSRSIVVILALVMVVCFPIAFLNVAPNLTNVINTEQETYNLAHYNMFFDSYYDRSVADNISNYIADYLKVSKDNFIVEPKIFTDSKMRSAGEGSIPEATWISMDLLALDDASNNQTSQGPKVSKIELTAGTLPTNDTGIVLLDSLAKSDNLHVGNVITLYQRAGDVQYRIVGLAKSIEYSSYDLSQTGVGFLSISGMERLTNKVDLANLTNEVGIYFDINLSKDKLIQLSEYLKEKIEGDGVNIVLFWFVRETSFRKALLDALNLTSEYMAAASIFIFLVAGVVIFVVTNRYITEQKTRIGALYSFGVRRRQIMVSFFIRVLILSIIAIITGLIIAKQLLGLIIRSLVRQWGLIGYSDMVSTNSIVFTLISAAIVAYLFTFLAVINLVKLTPYEAMRGKTSELKNRGLLFKFSSLLPSRILRSAAKNLTRNRTRTVLTVIAFTIALTFSGSLLYTNQSINHTITDFYQHRVNYDVEVEIGYDIIGNPNAVVDNDIMNLPQVAHAEYFINNLVQLVNRPEILTYILGMQRNTSMYDFSPSNILEGRWFKENTSEVVISRYLQGSIGIEMNDTLSFEYFGLQFNGTVVGITNDIQFSTAFFMDLTYLNTVLKDRVFQLLGQNTIVANKLLLQLNEGVSVQDFQDNLNTNYPDVSIALTSASYERRSIALSESQTAIIFLMVALGLVVGVVSVFTTLLIAVVERERELALLQVFGYRWRELLFQILLEGWIIGVISLIPTFLAARLVTENLWITIISNNIYQVFPVYTTGISIFLIAFALVSISLSIIPAFRSATSAKMSEVIREE